MSQQYAAAVVSLARLTAMVRATAARALWRLGEAPAKLTAPLVDNIKAGWHRHGDPISVLVDMGAVGAIPRLEKLASRSKRLVNSGIDDDIVGEDETLQAKLREAVRNLRSSPLRVVVPTDDDERRLRAR